MDLFLGLKNLVVLNENFSLTFLSKLKEKKEEKKYVCLTKSKILTKLLTIVYKYFAKDCCIYVHR